LTRTFSNIIDLTLVTETLSESPAARARWVGVHGGAEYEEYVRLGVYEMYGIEYEIEDSMSMSPAFL
jgi:hypothetical protein